MFRLEKVFQNDDKLFIYFGLFFKSLIIYFVIYLFIILENNSIYEVNKLNIYTSSNYYFFSIFFPILFFFSNLFYSKKTKFFNKILKESFKDIKITLINILILYIFFNLKKNFLFISKEFLLLIFLIFFCLIFSNFALSKIYNYLVLSNIIQRNILLVGNYKDILKVLKEEKNLINIYKCCFIIDINNHQIKTIRNEIKIPIFNLKEDVRSILEYHHLGQIWILDNSYNQNNVENMINYVINFPVDILIIKIDKIAIQKKNNLINNKYEFINYEISKFHGLSFLLKIFLDKILSIFFLVISSPILLLIAIFIYLEDGFPIIFTQDRTGWDGRRFKLYKFRSLYNEKYNPLLQVTADDKRKLKIGKFIRRYSLDEIPQFLNVLKGEMSIVGPRPHPVTLDLNYSKIYKSFLTRYKCNPGITGWSQINGYRGPTIDNKFMKKRLELDIWYLNNWSLYLDILIIIKTTYAIFKYKGE